MDCLKTVAGWFGSSVMGCCGQRSGELRNDGIAREDAMRAPLTSLPLCLILTSIDDAIFVIALYSVRCSMTCSEVECESNDKESEKVESV